MKITTPIWLERFVNSYFHGKVTATASSLMTMALNGLFNWPTAKKSLFIKTKFSLFRFLKVHLSHLTFGLSFFWTALILDCQLIILRVHYTWTLNTPVLRRLSNLFTIEISTVHVLNIYFYTVLVQKQLCQHWSFSCHPNGRYRRDRARFNKHAFFKALPLVFTCGIAAVLYYNSPKCHNYIIIKIMWYMMMF